MSPPIRNERSEKSDRTEEPVLGLVVAFHPLRNAKPVARRGRKAYGPRLIPRWLGCRTREILSDESLVPLRRHRGRPGRLRPQPVRLRRGTGHARRRPLGGGGEGHPPPLADRR